MATTNPLDGLLAIRNDYISSRWNFQDAIGSPVLAPGGIGNAAAVSFSFLSAVPSYFSATGFVPFSELQKQAARDVLASISDVIQVTFTEQPTNGAITFGMYPQPDKAAYAYFPSFGYSFSGDTIIGVTVSDLAGDVWFNSNQAWTDSDFAIDGPGYGTLIHELGHALGLKHPFDDTNVLDASLDNNKYTVMSYTPHPNSFYRTVTETSPGHFSWQYEHIQPETLMPLDIVALQYLYGANKSFHAGNDNYTFETNRPFIKTIWDGGGNDTISVANFSLPCVIDLRAGKYSTINIPSDALPPGVAETQSGIYDGTDNLTIAYGAILENAQGGSGNDRLIGNSVANNLTGNNGADKLTGGGGADALTGGQGADRFVFLNTKDSGKTVKSRDIITDFKSLDGDKIDLSAIDANSGNSGNNAFASLKQGAGFNGGFANTASLFFDQTAKILYANNDADAQADFSILLTGVTKVSLADFVV